MTLSKIAKLAHVSVSTASKAFSGSSEVNGETREMIFAVARKYGCFKKFYNAKYPKLVIALLCPEFNSLYYMRQVSLIQKCLEDENCEICVAATNFSPEKEQHLMAYYDTYSKVDGIIVIEPQTCLDEYGEMPVVFINPHCQQHTGLSLSCNAEPGFADSVAYLCQRHVSSVGFIGEKLSAQRLRLFRKTLLAHGLSPEDKAICITEERFEAGGYRAMEQLLAHKPPRALICAYDYMAIGAIRCIYDHGLTVPKDIAVLGIDDIPEAPYLNPPLASISLHTEQLCRMAAKAMISRIQGEDTGYLPRLDATWHWRASFDIT